MYHREEALTAGLVDEIGNLHDAIEGARFLA
jgi:ClpP class serine protease